MSALAKSHSDPNPLKRKPNIKTKAAIERYKKVDELVDFVYADYCNGVSKSDILQKLMQGCYDGHKALSFGHSYEYIKAAEQRIAFNTYETENGLREVLYTRYEALLEDSIKNGDTYMAKNILDSIAKIFLPQTPNTAVQINSNNEKVQISFGFSE